MTRYCIICRSMFGCIKESIKYSCESCPSSPGCLFPYDSSKVNVTSGICENCWGNHGRLRGKERAQAA
jgi:hypothetical protein